jgi:hypothetical protein
MFENEAVYVVQHTFVLTCPEPMKHAGPALCHRRRPSLRDNTLAPLRLVLQLHYSQCSGVELNFIETPSKLRTILFITTHEIPCIEKVKMAIMLEQFSETQELHVQSICTDAG